MSVTPFPDESFQSIVLRWAALNDFDSVHAFTGGIGVEYANRPSQLFSHADLSKLSEITGLDHHDLASRAIPLCDEDPTLRTFFGLTLSRRDVDLRVRRFAPASLRKAPYHRALWQIRTVPYCIESWQSLSELCPDCGTRQRWSRGFGLDLCDRCLGPLDQAPAHYADEAFRPGLKLAASIIHPIQSVREKAMAEVPTALQSMGSSATYELLMHLACHAKSDPVTNLRHLSRLSVEELARRISEAASLIKDWPLSLLNQIKTDVVRHEGGQTFQSNYAQSLLQRRTMYLSSTVKAELASVRDSKNPSISPSLNEITYSGLRFRHVVGVFNADVDSLIRTGGLKSHLIFASGGWKLRYDREEADRLRRDRIGSMDIHSISYKLGISIAGVYQLIDKNIVKILNHPFFIENYNQLRIHKSSYNSLVHVLRPTHGKKPVDGVSVRNVMRRIGGRQKPWGLVIEYLIDHPTSFFVSDGTGQLVDRILVPPSLASIMAKFEYRSPNVQATPMNDWMSKTDAVEYLNVNPLTLLDLVKDLELRDIHKSHALNSADIHRMGDEFISSIEIAARTGRRAARLLREVGLGWVTQPKPRMYPRSVVEHALANWE